MLVIYQIHLFGSNQVESTFINIGLTKSWSIDLMIMIVLNCIFKLDIIEVNNKRREPMEIMKLILRKICGIILFNC